jgi:phosphatidylglycerophosphatase C
MVIGTRLSVDSQNRITGGFDSPNCRGQEKVERLRQVFGAEVRLTTAYGDTSGDIEMLGIADEPHMKLFKGKPDEAEALFSL